MPLKHGDHGEAVKSLQSNLARLGYPLPRSTRPDKSFDGIVGEELLHAARLAEQDRHWPPSPPGEIADSTPALAAQARPFLRGLDVSKYQGHIDWSAVAAAGYRFVYVKATEGDSFVDPTWQQNARGARAAGLLVGGYHFWWPTKDPAAQARHFCQTLAAEAPLSLPPALDVEKENDLSPSARNEHLQTLISTTKELSGITPALYSSRRVYTEWGLTVGGECHFWMVSWSDQPRLVAPFHDWRFWQTGHAPGIPGISTDVDRDLFQGTEDELRALIAR
jgi:lysozyme